MITENRQWACEPQPTEREEEVKSKEQICFSNNSQLWLRPARMCGWVAILSCLALSAWGQNGSPDLTKQSLEDLMNIEVTSVSRKQEKLSQTPSAVFVIRSEDISRSGATNIPDLLRMVPGVHVAQINANKWAIGVRGFANVYATKLLVMVDGRSVYTDTFGGVLWDELDVPLENIERIEVIRGPGAAVWGANAVNGIINIITKTAANTQGAMVVAGGGNVAQEFTTAEFGGKLGKDTDYRIFSKYANQGQTPDGNSNGGDGWHSLRGGFRSDSKLSTNDSLMLKGDIYSGREGFLHVVLASVGSPLVQASNQVNLSGGHLQSVWVHTLANGAATSLEASFDSHKRNDLIGVQQKTFNLDFQHHFAWGRRQDIVWGLGYRNTHAAFVDNPSVSMNPSSLDAQLFSGFAQDRIALIPNRLSTTLGMKIEHNHFTHFYAQPSARIDWTPNDHSLFWAGVSKAARTPSFIDTAIRANLLNSSTLPNGLPLLVSLFGNPAARNEGLVSYEVGHRKTLSTHLSVDIGAYYNRYTSQQTIEPAAPHFEASPGPPHLLIPAIFNNLMRGESHGFEIAGNWKVTDRWTLSPGYTLERIHMHLLPGSHDTASIPNAQGTFPAQSSQLRSHLALSSRLGWDVSTYFVGRLQSIGVPSYTRLDTAISWQWTEGLSLSVVGQNLLTARHMEFNDANFHTTTATQIKRGAYAKFTWRF